MLYILYIYMCIFGKRMTILGHWIQKFLKIWFNLLKKSLMEILIFCILGFFVTSFLFCSPI